MGVAAVYRTICKIVGVVDRGRCQYCRQDKTVIGIHGGVFFESVMRSVFLNHPIRIQVAVELKRLAVFVQLAFRVIVFVSRLFDFIAADRPTAGFNQSPSGFLVGGRIKFKTTKVKQNDSAESFFVAKPAG